jgi:UDP-N-acetylglucosamine:LPS N-acetylglucosamine transferase
MNDSRTILVLTNDAGLGHRQAALATVAALGQRYGDLCRPILVNPLEEPGVPAMLRNTQSEFNRVVRFAPALYRFGHGLANTPLPTRLMERLEVLTLTEPIGRVLARVQPDVVVTTHPVFVYLLTDFRRRWGETWPVVVLVTDLARLQRLWFRPEVDLYLVPTTEAAALAARRGIAAERVHVTGIPVDLRLSERPSRAEVRAAQGWDPARPTVLAVGSRRVQEFTTFLRAINEADLPIQLVVVTGDDADLLAEVQTIDWRGPAHLYGYVTDLPVWLRAVDAVVTKAGGLTVAEALAAGCPSFIIQCTPMHERGNADYVVAHGAGVRAESPAALVAALRHALADGGRPLAHLAECARALGRPRAAYHAAELIWEQAERHAVPQLLAEKATTDFTDDTDLPEGKP